MNALSAYYFNNATGDAETGVVVAPHRAWRRELRFVAHFPCKGGEAIDTSIVGIELAFPSWRMRQQMPDLDVLTYSLIHNPKFRNIPSHRRLQLDPSLMDQVHDCRCCDG